MLFFCVACCSIMWNGGRLFNISLLHHHQPDFMLLLSLCLWLWPQTLFIGHNLRTPSVIADIIYSLSALWHSGRCFFKLLSGKEEGDSVKRLLLYTDMRSADQNFIVAPRHSAYKSGSFRCGVSKSLSRRCGLPPCVSLRLFALFRFFRTFPFIYQTSRCICGAFPPTKPFLNWNWTVMRLFGVNSFHYSDKALV